MMAKLEKHILYYAPYILLVIGTIGLLLFFLDQGIEIYNAIVLFLTLVAILFYVKDTRRLADFAAGQNRILWISNNFKDLSSRIDAISKNVKEHMAGGVISGNWDEHRQETISHFEVLILLSPSTEFRQTLIREKQKIEEAFDNKRYSSCPSEMLKTLGEVKKKLQESVGSL